MDGQRKSVIILEDDPDISDLLAQLIRSYGASPTVCSDEQSVLRAVEQQNVALALLDIMLPGTDGRETLSALRKQKVSFPIYFMTGINTNEISEAYFALADGVLQKPFSIKALRNLLDKTLALPHVPETPSEPRRKLLELMATVATEQESIRRQQARLAALSVGLERNESQSAAEQLKEVGMALEASLARVSSELEALRLLLDPAE